MKTFGTNYFLLTALLLCSFTGVNSQAMKPVKEKPFGKTMKAGPGVVSCTFRNGFQKNAAATLDTIMGLGITNIEFSNLFGKTAVALKQLLDERAMRCTSFGVDESNKVNIQVPQHLAYLKSL